MRRISLSLSVDYRLKVVAAIKVMVGGACGCGRSIVCGALNWSDKRLVKSGK